MTSTEYKRLRATYRAMRGIDTDLVRARGYNAAARVYGVLVILSVLAVIAAVSL
jgi:hypothetical protein